MGDVSDMVSEGVFCQECGVLIDSDDWIDAERMAGWHPRFCSWSGGNPETNGATKRWKGTGHEAKKVDTLRLEGCE